MALFKITMETHQPYGFDETSMIEHLQLLYLLACIVLFLFAARQHASLKSLSVLLAGMALIALIREMDHFFDQFVFDGAWQTAVLLIAASVGFYVFKYRDGLKTSIVEFSTKASFGYMVSAFFVIFVYSRIIGMKSLWQTVLGEHYLRISKTLVQEGTELFGYTLLAIAATEFFIESTKLAQKRS